MHIFNYAYRMHGISTIEKQLLTQLDTAAVTYKLYEHEAVHTVLESDKINANIMGAHTKNLFLKDTKNSYYLVTVLANKRVDLGCLSNILSAGRLSFGSAEDMKEFLRVSPGSVTPLAAINDRMIRVSIVLDEILAASPIVNVHPLRNTATLSLSGLNLVQMLVKWRHAPTILSVPSKPIP